MEKDLERKDSNPDQVKKIDERSWKKTKCQACGQIGHWAGDSICPKKRAMAHLAVRADGDVGLDLKDPDDLHGIPSQSLMAIKRPTKQTAKGKDHARPCDKIVHVPEDQVIGVSDSDQSIVPESRETSRAIIARASSEE